MKPYYEHAGITIYHGDCLEILPQLPSRFDLVLTDPPYGTSGSTAWADRFSRKADPCWKTVDRSTIVRHTPVIGDDRPFEPSRLLDLAGKIILWGANWYAAHLPASGGWLVWDKRDRLGDVDNWPMSDSELAWSNIGNSVHTFRHMWFGLIRASETGDHFHPTQKPVALMSWCIRHSKLPSGSMILDPYCGSGPSLQAAKQLNMSAIGIEIEEKYCEIAAKRLSQEVLQFEGATT